MSGPNRSVQSRRRRNSRPSEVQRLRSELSNLKISVLGGSYKPSVDPPATVVRPWYNLTIVTTETAQGSTKISDYQTLLGTYLGITTSQQFEVRIERIAAWSKAELALDCFDYTRYVSSAAKPQSLVSITDQSTPETYARVGYRFPTSISRATFYAPDNVVFQVVSAADAVITVHTHLLWRVGSPTKPV